MSTRSWRLRTKTTAVSLSVASIFACSLARPSIAHADEPTNDCEPGSWFCGDTQDPAQEGTDLKPLPAAEPAEPEAPAPAPAAARRPPPPRVVATTREAPPPYRYVPKKPPRKSEWGVNLHLGGAMMGDGREGNAGMGLLGVGMRYRPIPYAAIEGNTDLALGRDYNGNVRGETALTLNGLVFLNPRNITQVYLLGGFGWSAANVVDDHDPGYERRYHYAYFGVQAGVGLEFRLSRAVALNVDVRGFLRGRIDGNRHRYTEYVSSDGRATNGSGAGLLQGGMTVYW